MFLSINGRQMIVKEGGPPDSTVSSHEPAISSVGGRQVYSYSWLVQLVIPRSLLRGQGFLESGPTGRLSNGTCGGKGSPAKISDRSDCFSSVIPRSLLRGSSFSHSPFSQPFPFASCLRARLLILLANGITEALLQLFLSRLDTAYARALCEYRSASQ